jgi:ABC-type Zn uptake system ZnuABC Zn-binding protein ZnuA
MFIRKLIPVLILTSLLLAACGGSSPIASNSGLKVIASTTFLTDLAQNVAGDQLQVDSLLPPGADPHEYQAVPSDVRKVAESAAVIVNGLDYDQFIQPLLDNAGGARLIIVASDGLEARQMEEETDETVTDPHMWMAPTRVIKYVENIRDGLTEADLGGVNIYKANADMYISQLKELDTWITEQVAQIPQERRLLVTNHDSLGYFAEEYGFTVIGTIVPGVSSEAAPSAQQMAALIGEIRSTGAPAVFLNTSDNPHLADQVASETNITVVTDLYIETLSSPDGLAATYIDMMKYNVSKIVEALK